MTIDQFEKEVAMKQEEQYIPQDEFDSLMREFDEIEEIAGQPDPEPTVVDKAVNQPNHYQFAGMEIQDLLKKLFTHDEYVAWIRGNIIKYRMRASLKNKDATLQDIDKSNKYREFYNQYVESKAMGQVTIYLDNNVETKMKEAAKSEHLSVSKWVARIIEEKTTTEWPQDIVKLAGSWKDDFPTIEELRMNSSQDNPREAL